MKLHKIIQKTGMGILTILISSCFTQFVTAQGYINLVSNGGFDTDASGWTITNVGIGGGYTTYLGNPPGSVDLYNPLFGSSYPSPTASQEINSLTPRQFYTVSGDYSGGGKDTVDNSFGVALNGVFLFETNAPPTSGWYTFSFEYMATSTSALLSLEAQINGTDYSYAIDNIAMYEIPEPSGISLISLGVGVAIYVRRRHH